MSPELFEGIIVQNRRSNCY